MKLIIIKKVSVINSLNSSYFIGYIIAYLQLIRMSVLK